MHENTFIIWQNNNLEQFSDFFHRLLKLSWERKVVDNRIINGDSEIVNAAKRLGLYEKISTPYIPLPCEPGIDFTKIFGTWRTVGNWYDNSADFYKLTSTKKGVCYTEKIEDGSPKKRTSAKFLVNTRDTIFTIKTDIAEYRYMILKLTESCFEYRSEDKNDISRLDRLSNNH